MLKLNVKLWEYFDQDKEEFVSEDLVLELEHSLVALSKWESKFEKPFLSSTEKTPEEIMEYILMMILTPEYPPDVLDKLSEKNIQEINDYVEAKMTASWVNDPTKSFGSNREKITSELIYYWMVSYQIPWEAQYWHLSRLFMLIKIFNAKSEKPKKLSAKEMAAKRRALNEQRRADLGTKG